MTNLLRIMKPFDIVIIIALLFISFTPSIIFAMTMKTEAENIGADNVRTSEPKIVANIIQNGTVIRKVTLTNHKGNEQFIIKGEGNQYNLMEVDNERIRIKEDNSPDQIGVMMGWKSQPGEFIICLPHNLFVEIVQIDGAQEDEVILSQ